MLEAHGLNRRKRGRSYEASHALAVAMIVSDFGFDEDTVIAALLHDTLEDTELDPAVIEDRFGAEVLSTVRDLSEPPKPAAWRQRKLKYIAQLQHSPRTSTRAVACADKIHNLSKMTTGLLTEGPGYFDPFTAGLDDMLWYQTTVLETLRSTWDHLILAEHVRRFEAFRAAADRPTHQ